MNSTKFRCFLNQKTPMQTVSFVNMHDKVYGLNWRLCGENVACTKDARCEFFFSKFLCTSGWFSSAATDATLKFSSDNELCDFIMEQTSCSHPNWSNLHVKEYHWLGEQAVSPHCWSPLAGYEVKSVTLSMLISVFTELHAFVSHVCLTWLPYSPSRPAFCLLLWWNLNWRVTSVTHWRWSKCSCFEGDFQGEIRHCVRRLTWAW